MFFQLVFRIAVLSFFAVVPACSTLPESGSVPVKKAPQHAGVTPDARVPDVPFRSATPPASTAWTPLLAKADQATNRGDYEKAMALLERAQRIDPDSAEVYLGMAKAHSAKGDHMQARATAERGLLYCSGKIQCDALRGYAR
ncbi:MAG: tetratricopeptide repeat protein [Halioglobus sp.]